VHTIRHTNRRAVKPLTHVPSSVSSPGGFVRRISPAVLLALVILIALLLRVWGINADLPYIYHPDEPVALEISLGMFKTGDMNPHFLYWPSLLFYLNFLAYIPYYLFGKLAGVFQTPESILAPVEVVMGATYAPMPTVVLLGRLLSVGFGLGSVLVAYLIGRRLTQRAWVGLLAALLVAVSPTTVWHSRWIAPDTMATFFVLASLYASLRVYQEGRTRDYVLAAVCVGLAASSKYNALLAVLPLLVAHVLRHGRQSFKKRDLYVAIVLSGLVFLHTTPFAVLDFREFFAHMEFNSQHYATGHPGMEGDTVRWYLEYLWNTSGPVLLLALVGMVWGIASRSRETVILSTFPVVYLLFISRFTVRNDRTLLPALAFLFLLAVLAIYQLHGRLTRSASRAMRFVSVATLAALVLVIVGLMSSLSAQDSLRLNTVDSRETARVWIAENLPSGTKVALESYAPFVDPDRFSVQGFFRMIDHTPEWYVEQGFEYLVFAEGIFGRFYAEPERYATEIAQYDAFFERFELIQLFTDGGYEVRVYRANPEPAVLPLLH
jgi:4-amino-4-deoxy-L-arabinose transferase-like glycosyltransferase